MPRLRIQALAKAQNLNISQLQLKVGVAMGTMRRYWYGTKDGKQAGEPLKEVDLDILDKIAQALGVRVVDLIEETDWLAPALAVVWTAQREPGRCEAAWIAGTIPAPQPQVYCKA